MHHPCHPYRRHPDPEATRNVPSLAFLITHPGSDVFGNNNVSSHRPFRLMFDLGLRSSAERYMTAQQKHLKSREPYQLKGAAEQLKAGGIAPEEIDVVLLSHVHYDHHGDPEDFPHAKFLVGHGALSVLKHGLSGKGSHQHFDPNLLPADRAEELPAPDGHVSGSRTIWQWRELGPFPAALDLLGDGSIYAIDTPGHLPGHVNLLCRTGPQSWVCLAGDAYHDQRLLTGEKEIGCWADELGELLCIHLDKDVAGESIGRLRRLAENNEVELIAAHDDGCMASIQDSVGFVGLGVMGLPMVENLIKKLPADTRFYVFDVSKHAMEALSAQHPSQVEICSDAREVADKSNVVLSMVPEGSHVRAVYLTPDTGVLAANVDGKLLIDCSTIDTATSLEVREKTKSLYPSASFYDAPVSGGSLGAQKATLTFMLGCARKDPNFSRIEELLSKMGASVFACGGPSLGLTAKLCNNYCSGLIAIATSEAMNIGMASGMDPRVLKDIFHTSTAQSAILDKWCPVPGIIPEVPSSNGYKGGFKVQLMRKDFGLAVDTAKRLGVRLALGDVGLATYTATMNDPRFKDLDSRVVYRYLGGRDDWKKDFDDVD
ncbi:hypothetical protein V501_10582 [Neofusicoccum parvum]|nr:hypothetical protein V501_10582 [Neofusicoccum parvum]